MRAVESDGASDAELLNQARSGDDAAFFTLWSRHEAFAARSAAGLVRNLQDGEDLVATVRDRIWQALRNGRGPTVAFRSYLCTSLRNSALDQYRHAAVVTDEVERMLEGECSVGPVVEDELVVRAAFGRLSERHQEALALAEVSQLSTAEVGSHLGLSANAAAQLVHRARRALRYAWIDVHLDRRAVTDPACVRTCHLLRRLVAGDASDAERERVDEHLATCDTCRGAHLTALDSGLGRSALTLLLLGPGAERWLAAGGLGARRPDRARRLARHGARRGGCGVGRAASVAAVAGGLVLVTLVARHQDRALPPVEAGMASQPASSSSSGVGSPVDGDTGGADRTSVIGPGGTIGSEAPTADADRGTARPVAAGQPAAPDLLTAGQRSEESVSPSAGAPDGADRTAPAGSAAPVGPAAPARPVSPAGSRPGGGAGGAAVGDGIGSAGGASTAPAKPASGPAAGPADSAPPGSEPGAAPADRPSRTPAATTTPSTAPLPLSSAPTAGAPASPATSAPSVCLTDHPETWLPGCVEPWLDAAVPIPATTVPPITVPPITVPVTTPPITTPAVTVPVTTPAVTVPVTTPVVTVPITESTAPPTTTAPITAPTTPAPGPCRPGEPDTWVSGCIGSWWDSFWGA